MHAWEKELQGNDLGRRVDTIEQDAMRGTNFLSLKYLHAAPSKTFAGMVILADGSDYDPGSGAGMYRRNEANSAWVFLG